MEVLRLDKTSNVPVKAIPEESLNKMILGEWEEQNGKLKQIRPGFTDWLTDILSIKNTEENAKKLGQVLLMIKESAWSLSLFEIKKAFTMYVKGELPNLEPRDNYLTPVLFSNVINAYKQTRPQKKHEPVKLELSKEEKERNAYLNCIYAYDEWKQDGFLKEEYHWVYDTLKEKGLLKISKEESKSLNEYLREKYPEKDRDYRMKKGKVLLLERMFERLKVHIKEILV